MPISKPLCLLECPTNLGLLARTETQEPGVRKLPDWLNQQGFHAALRSTCVHRLEAPPYTRNLDEASGVRNADAIASYAVRQADLLEETINRGKLPLVIGGDCSVLIGIGLGLKRRGRYGLFFLDGHTDFMAAEMSRTGGAAGMDLAIVTGHAHPKLSQIEQQGPYFREEDVFAVGNREYSSWYVNAIEQSAIRYISLNTFRQMGWTHCISQFRRMVRTHNLNGYWLHIDADVLHNDIMPAVDSPQPDGLVYQEFIWLVMALAADPLFAGLNFGILDPDLDPQGQFTRSFIQQFCPALLTGLSAWAMENDHSGAA